MIARNVFQLIFKVLIYLLTYFLVTSHIGVFHFALCFSYVGAILLLPLGSNSVRTILFSFLVGMAVDVFHSSLGIHTAACVLLGFFRASFINWMVPAGGYEEYMTITVPSMGLKWFFPYAFGLLFLHHFLYFLIDYASTADILMALLRALASALLTFCTIVLIQFGIEPPARNT